jgi:hypothetical protein
MKRFNLLGLLVLLATPLTAIQAQPTCDTVTLTLTGHGHGAITVSRVWVDDPDNFAISMERTLPFDAVEGETFDVRICILKRDGRTYSTVLRYETNHGASEWAVTLTAPNPVSGISMVDETRRPRALVYPTVATDRIQIQFNRVEPAPIVIRLFDTKGEIVRHRALTELPPRGVALDVRDVCAGPYHLTIQIAGVVVGVHPIIIVR